MTAVEEAVRPPDSAEGRRTRRAAVHTFRPHRSWPAIIAALVILAVAVLAAVEIISALAGAPLRLVPFDQAADYAAGVRWNEPGVRIASGVVAVVGLLLLALALIPGRGGYLPLRTEDPSLVVGLSLPGLRRALAAAAREVNGVSDAQVTVGGRRVAVRAETTLRRDAEMRDAVRESVERRLAELDPLRRFTVRARVVFAKV